MRMFLCSEVLLLVGFVTSRATLSLSCSVYLLCDNLEGQIYFCLAVLLSACPPSNLVSCHYMSLNGAKQLGQVQILPLQTRDRHETGARSIVARHFIRADHVKQASDG